MRRLTDIALISRVVIFHDQRAFSTLVKRYQSPIRRFFLQQTAGDEALSDDLAQETFIKAYTSLNSFKNISKFSTWLYRIAYNVFYDYIRTRKETQPISDVMQEVDSKHAVGAADGSIKADMNVAMKLLTLPERTCITLFFMEDLPLEQIATITNMPVGTVKSHISRGKTKLQTYLTKNGYERR